MQRRILWQMVIVAILAASATSAAAQLTRPPTRTPTVYSTSGRYRVSIAGFAAAKETVDKDTDGRKDEIYPAAAFVLWDRRDGRIISVPNVIRAREYGDIQGQNYGRIQAGTASRSGGLWGGNGPDYVPTGLDPRAPVGPAPSADQLPLLIFEGGLSDGVEALLVAPSLWESDNAPVPYNNYVYNWKNGGISKLLNAPVVQNQLTSSSLTSMVVPMDPAVRVATSIANIFTGGIIGAYLLTGGEAYFASNDRPVGLMTMAQASQYQDRVVVVTREKLASLAVGQGITIAIPFAEPLDHRLNGIYTAYLRVERLK